MSQKDNTSLAISILKLFGVAALYALLYKVTMMFLLPQGGGSPFFVASGLALAALLIGGRRYAWSVFLGALLANVSLGFSVLGLLGMASASTSGAMLGAWLLTRDGKFDTSLSALPDYLKLAGFGGFLGSSLGALIGATTLLLSGILNADNYLQNMIRWWMGDALGVLLVTPLILAWFLTSPPRADKRQLTESVLIIGLTALAGQIVFLGWFHDSIGHVARGYWMFLFIVWVAVRLHARGTTVVLLITATQAVVGAYLGVGFFGDDLVKTQLTNFWFYMLILSVVGMALATYISARKRMEDDLRIAASVFESQEGMVITDANGVIMRINPAFTDVTGYTEQEALGQRMSLLKSGRHESAFYAAMWQSINETGGWQGEIWNRRKDGEVFPEWLTISAVKGDEGKVTHYVGSLIDITERKEAEEKIHTLAYYDALTHLPNRRLLMDRLHRAASVSARNNHFDAVLFLDLDYFKTLNESKGYDVGNLLLLEVARRLESISRDGDTVARLGSDEFVIVLEALSVDQEAAAAQAEMVAGKIQAALSQPYLLNELTHHITLSIGIVLFRGQQENEEDLLKHAEVAMYQAKTAGRNAIRFHDQDMQSALEMRAEMEGELRQAIDRHQLRLYYQVQVDSLGRPLGAEALVRWAHPERGLVSPMHFIPLAEETGLILTMGLWILQTACAQLKAWQQNAQTRELSLAVNVSAKQFRQAEFVEQVQRVLLESGAKPSNLKLELTESILLENVDDIISKMRELKVLGVRFSLDDFGTGYSSLQYLKRLPLDQIKIDQSFVRDISQDANDAAIVQTIIAMSEALGLKVIAEGVETKVQQEFLESHGCHAFQGYLFGKPVTIEQFEEQLHQLGKIS